MNICLFSTLFLSEAFDKNTANITTDSKLQQLNKFTIVNEVKMMAKLINSKIEMLTKESFTNYF